MLQITGKYLGLTSEWKNPPPGARWEAFEAHTISVMVDGPGGVPRVEPLQAAKGFDYSSLEGLESNDEVSFEVTIDAFNTRYGGGYRLNAHALIPGDSVDAGSWVDSVKTEGSFPRAVGDNEPGF